MGWCPVYAPSEADGYQYDHPMQKYDLPWLVYRCIEYTIHDMHELALHPPQIAIDQQEECTCNVKRDFS